MIGRVAGGETWVPPSELGRVFWLLLHERDDPFAALTRRERDVLRHVAEGADRKEVAARLHLSVNTVRTHMQHLTAKLGVHSALEAVALTRPRLGEAEGPGARRAGPAARPGQALRNVVAEVVPSGAATWLPQQYRYRVTNSHSQSTNLLSNTTPGRGSGPTR